MSKFYNIGLVEKPKCLIPAIFLKNTADLAQNTAKNSNIPAVSYINPATQDDKPDFLWNLYEENDLLVAFSMQPNQILHEGTSVILY